MKINTIYCMDHLELFEILPENCIDLVVTSPPYGKLRDYKGYKFDYRECAKGLWKVVKPGGVVVWVTADEVIKGSESGESFRHALYFMETGFRLHDTEIFQKENYVPLTHRRYEQSFEYMFIFSKGAPKVFNPIVIRCKNPGKTEKMGNERRMQHGKTHSMRDYKEAVYIKTNDTKIHPNVFRYKLFESGSGHPAPFPEKLAADHIRSWSNPGDLVFDPMCGSGTTLKAAVSLNRDYLGCDISNEYCEISRQRLNKLIIKRERRKL